MYLLNKFGEEVANILGQDLNRALKEQCYSVRVENK